MPKEEVNAIEMGNEFLKVLDSAEATTDLWVQNTDIIAWFVIVIILLASFVGLIFLAKYILTKILHR